MSPEMIIVAVFGYFLFLAGISWYTTRASSSNEAFFTGNKQSPWFIVAFGMIGTSLSGVTFISVPGWVATSSFSYMQMVLGYLAGYLVIGLILMPLYYRLNLTSIYTYLEERFGLNTYKTGAWYFLISRVIGASFRLYLVAMVFQEAVFKQMGKDVPFSVTVLITIALIWVYTHRGGIKTIIWTDTLQTLFMLLAVVITLWVVANQLDLSFTGMFGAVKSSEYSQVFFWDWESKLFFPKQFLAGAFIAICMTGLDQDMMQKNLSCKSLGDAQKNMFWFSLILVVVNLLFLSLGALLYLFAATNNIAIPEMTDKLYPMLATEGYLGPIVGLLFVLGLIAAAYSSADSALTALTTSFCVDILGFNRKKVENPEQTRKLVHLTISIVLLLVIVTFENFTDDAVIKKLFELAGYTYGPLLGLYSFGLFMPNRVPDKLVPIVCILAPVICWLLTLQFAIGFELLIINGLITFVGLAIIAQFRPKTAS
ncbi:sodium:solute symporter [bacterium SCSIO 12741]|nr:sodium:solute symporter [bacterium SCSIO 12741]